MRTRTFVLIGLGLTLLSSLLLSAAQVYHVYKFQLFKGMGWLEFLWWHAWKPGFTIWDPVLFGMPHDLFDGLLGWFLFLLPGVGLLPLFHPFRKPQRVVLGVLVLLTIIDLCWLLQGWGGAWNAPDCYYVPTLLHLGLSALSVLCAIPLRLAVREELRRQKEEGLE